MQPNYKLVAKSALGRARILLPRWLPRGRWAGHEYQAVNPRRHDRSIGSFSVNVHTGAWADFAIGTVGGDLISLYAYLRGISNAQACREIASECGSLSGCTHPSAPSDNRKEEMARQIWKDAQPIFPECPAGLYLQGRGLELPVYPSTLQWHPNVYEAESRKSHPALIGKVVNKAGDLIGIQRIYLTHEGQKAPLRECKKMLGKVSGGAVRLTPATDSVIITEGIETGLAVMYLMRIPTWATLSTVGMEHVQLPRDIRTVYIAIDHDRNGAGAKAGAKLAHRLQREGRKCYLLDPAKVLPLPPDSKGIDWLDVLNAQKGGLCHD